MFFQKSLRLLAMTVGPLAICATLVNAQIDNPLPPVGFGNTVILIEEFSQVPNSGSGPVTRINHLKPAGDGSGRLFVNDLRGKMHLVSAGSASLYLDLKAEVGDPPFKDAPGLGTGFTSFAFHPEFASNGKLYTAHSEDAGTGTPDFTLPNPGRSAALQGVILEWTATDPSADVFAGTRREVMRVDIIGTKHGMQEISFNPNAAFGNSDFGMLYICIGDGETTILGYPDNTSRLDSVLGTILRIDPLGDDSPNGQYGVPADNPWASDGDAETFGEIWVYGFRNPHRISWDTGEDGILLSGDIGERNLEEVNLIEPGKHYGWNVREGTFRINPEFANNPGAGTNNDVFELPADDATLGYTYPVAQYDHDEGAAIVGGYVYRGALAPHMVGKYLFGEITDGELYIVDADTLVQGSQSEIKKLRVKIDGVSRSMLSIIGQSRTDIRFGYDEDNELYITSKRNAKVYKIVGSEGPTIPLPSGGAEGMVNISTRGNVGLGDSVLIGGFVVQGEKPMSVLIRAAGPTLGELGVADALQDTVLKIFDDEGGEIAANTNWQEASNAADIALAGDGVGAFEFTEGSKDSAILMTLEPGSYTAQVSGNTGTTGVALVEVYSVVFAE